MSNNKEEVVNGVVDHLKWTVEDKVKWKQPVCGAADYLLDAFTKQMCEVYDAGYNNGLEQAHEIADKTFEWAIQNMRDYAKKHPKTTLESYLKREYP